MIKSVIKNVNLAIQVNRLLQSFLLRNDGTAIKIAERGHAAQERIKKIVNGMQYD